MRTLNVLLLTSALLAASPVHAVVFDCDEAGLDDALIAARLGDPGPHTFSCTGPTTIPVTSIKIVSADITLDGKGLVTLDGVIGTRWIATNFSKQELLRLNVIGLVFDIQDSQLTLRRVHLSGTDDSFGPAAVNLNSRPTETATLNLIESTIEDNFACAVWGVRAPGQVSGLNEVVIDRSTISGNSGVACGGVSAFSVEISNSTISGNTYSDVRCEVGSGVNAAELQISHSTIVGNGPAEDLSYGLHELIHLPKPCRTCPPPDPAFVCVTYEGTPVIVENSIIGSCVNHAGVVAPSGWGNVESPGDTCEFDDDPNIDKHTVSALDLGLDVLADNGGRTETRMLLSGSEAIDFAVFSNCPMEDQRGYLRPETGGTECDSGAVEYLPEPHHAATMVAGTAFLGLLYRRRVRGLQLR